MLYNILHAKKMIGPTVISLQADIESPVPSICFNAKSFVSGLLFSSLSGTLNEYT